MLTYEVTNGSEEQMRDWKEAMLLNLWETVGKVVMDLKLSSTVHSMIWWNISLGMMLREADV